MADKAVQEAAPTIAALQRDRTMLTMLSLFLPHLRLHSQLIKLQYNAGSSGCFPLHYDSDESVDARRVTAILYLNPGWEPAHGGELQLFPWPRPPVTIPPLDNRLVIFSTCRMLHRVLPSLAERFCLTTWMSIMNPGPPPTPIQHLEAGSSDRSLENLAAQPEVRRALAKVHLKDSWAQSLIESHADSEARTSMLATFWREVELLQQKIKILGLDGIEVSKLKHAPVQWF
ncbi:hypothetical protein COCSUDRAFT_29112 [Coccomyxa subellipsoidea C-169]|uniref:Fe2OG dioxygenase domain-containing protein n=1 Tax=Coccomyxa subellipsoidea (strain C-169) TaxID=574566 RepID=I0YXJ9_COCSC|nr:hypothetical protein COCSUDRAFT_29112 [Coccomyxa subellipsoidea C-169]EIE23118.1 hypothetical protein COCSUDRAFT_29112 [Coccomyxa subellipsoidea C-169]|eukprot:XP_005647662.1 hypothetical protein COCSUDRAFT_29112 [Coccomyxa subellipsoidea C-169]